MKGDRRGGWRRRGGTAHTNEQSSNQKLTIGLDLGDRSSWYCVLDGSRGSGVGTGEPLVPKAMKEDLSGDAAGVWIAL